MKPAYSRLSILFLIVCAFLLGANDTIYARDIFASGHHDGGRLIIKRSPVLAYNITLTLKIDGRVAGTLVRGQVFDRYITPGQHVLVASPNRLRGDWQGAINVRPGHTYSYQVTYNVNRIVLNPVKSFR